MAVGLKELPHLYAVNGMRLATACAGIKQAERDDVALIEICAGAKVAAVFTRNAFCAAPVTVAKRHLGRADPRYCVINSGNANAGTGALGIAAAEETCQAVAKIATCTPEQVLPFSTGVIGALLPTDRICAALPTAYDKLDANGWGAVAQAIMTTDTVPKGSSRRVEVHGRPVTITGIAKGAGMIRPDMATMLAYVGTDAALPSTLLQRALQQAVDVSFNRISVDGDTSTNDACVLVATGRAPLPGAPGIDSPDFVAFQTALVEVCQELAQAIVRDGEGATHFISVQVVGAAANEEAAQVAYAIAHSPLVKTAFFAGDPNWGRILAAVGRAGVVALELDRVSLFLDEVCIVRNGEPAAEYREQDGQEVMSRAEITVRVELGRGTAATTVWTCDLSYDYVRINAEYRT